MISVLNLNRIIANIKSEETKVTAAVTKAVNDSATEVFSESQRRVPVDTGNLRASARIDAATDREQTATITYGGTAAQYALVVHEMHATQSKYLEGPLRDFERRITENINAAVRDATK